MITTKAALETRARRVARKNGLIARKSRWRAGSVDNFGGFMLVDESTNVVAAGGRFDMSAESVIEYFAASD